MKVAVFFPGRIKAYEHCIQDWLNIDRTDFTFFCSLSMASSDPYTDKFLETFNIKEEQVNFEVPFLPDWVWYLPSHIRYLNRNHIYFQFYHNKKCYDLITAYQEKHGVKFDIVLKYRADIIPSEGKTLELKMPEPNTVYIPFSPGFDPDGGINDQMGYGSYETMGYYCSLVEDIVDLTKRGGYHPESLVKHNLLKRNVNLVRVPFSWSLHPHRY